MIFCRWLILLVLGLLLVGGCAVKPSGGFRITDSTGKSYYSRQVWVKGEGDRVAPADKGLAVKFGHDHIGFVSERWRSGIAVTVDGALYADFVRRLRLHPFSARSFFQAEGEYSIRFLDRIGRRQFFNQGWNVEVVAEEQFANTLMDRRFTPSPGRSLIVMLRKEQIYGSGLHHAATVDGERLVGALPFHSFAALEVEPSSHRVRAWLFLGGEAAATSPGPIAFDLNTESDQTYYLFASVGWGGKPVVDLIDQKQALPLLADMEPVHIHAKLTGLSIGATAENW